MPQLTPFYFVKRVSFAFLLILILLYIFWKYILHTFLGFIHHNLNFCLAVPAKPYAFVSSPLVSSVNLIYFIKNIYQYTLNNWQDILISLSVIVLLILPIKVFLCLSGLNLVLVLILLNGVSTALIAMVKALSLERNFTLSNFCINFIIGCICTGIFILAIELICILVVGIVKLVLIGVCLVILAVTGLFGLLWSIWEDAFIKMPCTGPAKTNSGGKIIKILQAWISHLDRDPGGSNPSDVSSSNNNPSGNSENNPLVRLPAMGNPQGPARLTSIHTLFPSLYANHNNPSPNSHIPGFNPNIPPLDPDLVSKKGVIMHISDVLTRSDEERRVRPVTWRGHNFTRAEENTLRTFITSLPTNHPTRIRFQAKGLSEVNNTIALRQSLYEWISKN